MKKFTLLITMIASTLLSNAQFNLLAPANNAALNVEGNGNKEVGITWSPSALTGTVTYTWHLDLPTGNFSSPIVSVPSNNMGADTMLTLTYSTIKSVLEGAGVALNATAPLKWTVTASNGSTTVFATTPFNLTLTNSVVASNFDLTFPMNGFAATIEGDGSTTLDITWNDAGEGVTYAWFLDLASGDFSNPLVGPMTSNNNGNDTVLTLDYTTIDAVLAGAGVTNGNIANLQWKVHAYAGSDSLPSQNAYTLDLTKGVILEAFDHIAPIDNLTATIEGKADQTIEVSWNSAGMGATYEWSLDLATGDFSNPLAGPIMSNNSGMDTSLTLDYATINDVLEGAGVAIGTTANLKWIVTAKAGNATLNASSEYLLNLENGAVIDNFNLVAPMDGFEAEIADDASQDITISWNSAGSGATYKWFLAASSGTYADALVDGLPSNRSGSDTALTLDFATIYSVLESAGVASGATATLKWKVHAYGGSDSIPSSDYQIKLTRGATTSILDINTTGNMPNVYPNPAIGQAFITFNKLEGFTNIKIIDIAGNELQSIETNNRQTVEMNIESLNAGMYFIEYSGSSTKASQRLIVE